MSTVNVSENSIIREMLLTSISCGDPDLLNLLEDNIDVILLMNHSCYQEIDYLKAQLSMIDIAMVFSRNKVDEARTRGYSKGFDQYRAKYENESLAQRTSENRACNFADATSFQQFMRDNVNRMRSRSDMESLSTGSTQTTRWDRSTQSASGYSVVSDYASSSSDGEGRGSSIDTQINSGKSYSKTAREFGPDLNDLETYPDFVPDLPSPTEVIKGIGGTLSWLWNGISGAVNEGDWDTAGSNQLEIDGFTISDLFRKLFKNDPISGTFGRLSVGGIEDWPLLGCCCDTDGNPLTDCPEDIPYNCLYDAVNPLPSYGRGYNVKYNVSVGIPYIGVLRVDWGSGGQFRQSHTMTQGCTRSTGEGSTNNIYSQADFSHSEGSTDTHDEAQTTRDIHIIGDSKRDSRSDTAAGSATTGDAHSESHTGSDRISHAERRASNQGTSWSKGRGRGEGLTTSDSKSTTEVRHWSQIFKNLLEMYSRIFDQIIEYERIRALSIGISIGKIEKCQFSLPKDPICSAQLRRRSDYGLTKVYQ